MEKKNEITETIKQYIAAKYDHDIKSFDISLVIADVDAPDSLPECITGMGITIEEAFEDLMQTDEFIVQVFEDSASLAHYQLTWNGYDEQGYDIEDGYFNLTDAFAYLCNAYLKGKVQMKDIFAGGIEDFKFMCGTNSSRVPAEVFACKEPELLEEIA